MTDQSRHQDFAAWYQDVTLQGDMAEPAEIVKGCMVIKANGYEVWEGLQRELDDRFKAPGPRGFRSLPLAKGTRCERLAISTGSW